MVIHFRLALQLGCYGISMGLATTRWIVRRLVETGLTRIVDVFGRAVLVDDAVGPGRVVGHGLEGAGVERGIKPLSELVHVPRAGLAYCSGRIDAFMNQSVCSHILAETPEDGDFYRYGAIEYCLRR